MAIEPRPPAPYPERPATDHDRRVAVDRIQRAVAHDEVEFDELDDLFDQVYRATTLSEIIAVTGRLPVHDVPEIVPPPHPIARTSYSIFGDIKVGGWIAANGDLNYGSGFGKVFVDLSSADLQQDITVRVRSIFDDVTVVLPDGVRATMEPVTVFGDANSALTTPVAGAPYVRVVAASLFGNARLYSLSQVPQGRMQRLWRALRGR
ncbi:MAG: DUF1707 domain-containing protein [Acidimicrobiales bacterium]|nr:DUF1707 domain-containing protein [Acidimicrobiales bacterium]